jgi:hypothetical protein
LGLIESGIEPRRSAAALLKKNPEGDVFAGYASVM